MAFTLTQDLITEPQPAVEGMCLADWQALDGFDVDAPEVAAQLIHPRVVKAKTAGLLRSLSIERPGDSGNAGYAGVRVPSPCMHVVLHWWGPPVGQSHDGVVAWLRNPISQVSAHYVVSPGRVTQILPLTTPSWANGNYQVNATSITIEANPNDISGTIMTIVELLVQLVRDGALHPDYRLSGHRDHSPTACPGDYYPRLGAIRTAATTTQINQPSEEDELMAIDMDKFAAQLRDSMVIEIDGYEPMTIGEAIRYLIKQGDQMPQHLMKRMVRREGLPEGHPLAGRDTNLESVVAWFDAAILGLASTQRALADGEPAQAKEIVDELLARLGQLAPKEG